MLEATSTRAFLNLVDLVQIEGSLLYHRSETLPAHTESETCMIPVASHNFQAVWSRHAKGTPFAGSHAASLRL